MVSNFSVIIVSAGFLNEWTYEEPLSKSFNLALSSGEHSVSSMRILPIVDTAPSLKVRHFAKDLGSFRSA